MTGSYDTGESVGRYTLDDIDLESYDWEVQELAKKLNTSTNTGEVDKDSIMFYDNKFGVDPDYDDGFLSSGRLKYILDYFQEVIDNMRIQHQEELSAKE